MKIQTFQLSKLLLLDHKEYLKIWIKNISKALPKILTDLEGTIIKQELGSSFGIVIFVQSNKYGNCYLKFVPHVIDRYESEKNSYIILSDVILCNLIKYYDEYNCLVLADCGKQVSGWESERLKIEYFFKNVFDNRILYNEEVGFKGYEQLLEEKLINPKTEPPIISENVKKAVEIYNVFFNSKPLYNIHGDMHRRNLLENKDTIKAIDPIGYIAPIEIEFARYIGTELEMLVDVYCKEELYSLWRDLIDYFKRFSNDIEEAVYVDIVFRMHNATFECIDNVLVDRWLKVLSVIEKDIKKIKNRGEAI